MNDGNHNRSFENGRRNLYRPWDLWNVPDTKLEASYSMFCFGDCTHRRRVLLLCKKNKVSKYTAVNEQKNAIHFKCITSSYPSILVGYMEPKEV